MGIRDFVDTSYESDHTKFIREQTELHPEWADDKKAGRNIWWDKAPISPEEQQRLNEAKVANKGYPYNSNTR